MSLSRTAYRHKRQKKRRKKETPQQAGVDHHLPRPSPAVGKRIRREGRPRGPFNLTTVGKYNRAGVFESPLVVERGKSSFGADYLPGKRCELLLLPSRPFGRPFVGRLLRLCSAASKTDTPSNNRQTAYSTRYTLELEGDRRVGGLR